MGTEEIFAQRGKEEGYLVSEVRRSDLQGVEEEWNIHSRKILARQLRNSGTQGHLGKRLGVFQTNCRVRILKVIKSRPPS